MNTYKIEFKATIMETASGITVTEDLSLITELPEFKPELIQKCIGGAAQEFNKKNHGFIVVMCELLRIYIKRDRNINKSNQSLN